MFDQVSDSVAVRPLQLRLVGALLSVVVLTVVFGAGLYWVVPIVWVLFCGGVLAVAAPPSLAVAVDRAGLGSLSLAAERFRVEMVDVGLAAYSLLPVPTTLPSPAFVVGAGAALLLAQFAYTQRAVGVGTGGDDSAHAEIRGRVERIVTRLAAQADLEAPSVRVIDEPVPRTFAVGRVGAGAVVVTTGLVDSLDEAELEAVLAHEVAHFANDDVGYMSFLAFLPLLEDDSLPIVQRLAVTGGHLAASSWELLVATVPALAARGLERLRRAGELVVAKLVAVGRIVLALLLAVLLIDAVYLDLAITRLVYFAYSISGLSPLWAGIVGCLALSALLVRNGYPLVYLAPAWLFARLVAVAFSRVTGPLAAQFSRDREFAADRGAATLTGDPSALASALATLDPDAVVQSTDLREHSGLAALSIFPYRTDTDSAWERITDHPPTGERIDRLQAMDGA